MDIKLVLSSLDLNQCSNRDPTAVLQTLQYNYKWEDPRKPSILDDYT